MQCPKCDYISFDHFTSCAKCHYDLSVLASLLKGTTINAIQDDYLVMDAGAGMAGDEADHSTVPEVSLEEEGSEMSLEEVDAFGAEEEIVLTMPMAEEASSEISDDVAVAFDPDQVDEMPSLELSSQESEDAPVMDTIEFEDSSLDVSDDLHNELQAAGGGHGEDPESSNALEMSVSEIDIPELKMPEVDGHEDLIGEGGSQKQETPSVKLRLESNSEAESSSVREAELEDIEVVEAGAGEDEVASSSYADLADAALTLDSGDAESGLEFDLADVAPPVSEKTKGQGGINLDNIDLSDLVLASGAGRKNPKPSKKLDVGSDAGDETLASHVSEQDLSLKLESDEDQDPAELEQVTDLTDFEGGDDQELEGRGDVDDDASGLDLIDFDSVADDLMELSSDDGHDDLHSIDLSVDDAEDGIVDLSLESDDEHK